MSIHIVGGGPGGLYSALLLKKRMPEKHIQVYERNSSNFQSGWGVVLSDQTVDNLRSADAETAQSIDSAMHRWNELEVSIRNTRIRSGGHGFSGIGRGKLISILRNRCEKLGVEISYGKDVSSDLDVLINEKKPELIIASDGINSRTRSRYKDFFGPEYDLHSCSYSWLGTTKKFDAFTFSFVENEHGWFQAHAYQFDDTASTFIVETRYETYLNCGLSNMNAIEAKKYCENLFAHELDGHKLLPNASGDIEWVRFPRVSCRSWVHSIPSVHGDIPLVLLGDAAHSAHFSIGSGTKLALEDAISLSVHVSTDDISASLMQYEQERRIEVLKLQNAARNSVDWFENVDRYSRLPVEQFAYSLITRSQRISHENLRERDPVWLSSYERWFSSAGDSETVLPPALTPFSIKGVTLKNRIVVSPMAQYSADANGVPGDWHKVHIGARASGGAALVMTEMTAVSPEARITPWCPGLWTKEQEAAWADIVHYVHANTTASIGIQLGHAGAKGATRRMWDGIDQPLIEGEWPLIAPSETQYLDGISQIAREMSREDMERVKQQFVNSALLADKCGFDWLELHCAHGYLLSAFLSPLTNHRTDEYGGSVERRSKFPMEIFSLIRDVWPHVKPISVRISAHDWVDGGNTAYDAVEIARLFKQAGADVIDVSAGQVSKSEVPRFGRMWQTPFSDMIRQDAEITTIAVGAITDLDQANGIVASGRADLVAVGRPHLANPSWTLTEAARFAYPIANEMWPPQYLAGKHQLDRQWARERQVNRNGGIK